MAATAKAFLTKAGETRIWMVKNETRCAHPIASARLVLRASRRRILGALETCVQPPNSELSEKEPPIRG